MKNSFKVTQISIQESLWTKIVRHFHINKKSFYIIYTYRPRRRKKKKPCSVTNSLCARCTNHADHNHMSMSTQTYLHIYIYHSSTVLAGNGMWNRNFPWYSKFMVSSSPGWLTGQNIIMHTIRNIFLSYFTFYADGMALSELPACRLPNLFLSDSTS